MTKKSNKKKELTKQAEGDLAIRALYTALDKDGLLVDRKRTKDLEVRISKMESEVEVLKDLISRALNNKKNDILKG